MTSGMEKIDVVTPDVADGVAREYFGINGISRRLVGWANQNFLVKAEDGSRFVLKMSKAVDSAQEGIAAQHAALDWLRDRAPDLSCPRVVRSTDGRLTQVVPFAGQEYVARVLTYLEGTTLAAVEVKDATVFAAIGQFMGTVDVALKDFMHPGTASSHDWDLANALDVIGKYMVAIKATRDRYLVERMVSRVGMVFSNTVPKLRRSVIHNDANDHNLLVDVTGKPPVVTGLIDFGDLVETCTVFEPAVAATYAMLGREDSLAVAAELIRGYHGVHPLQPQECDLLFAAIVLRLCVSVSLSAHRSAHDPGDEYLTISETAAWGLLRQLESVSPHHASETFRAACEVDIVLPENYSAADVASRRGEHLGPNLSISYRKPVHIVRGSMQYLYDPTGREYLDTVNNVCHVGHCHPRVVHAAQEQISRLNTNTRYLNELLGEFAGRLCATLPAPLEVCYFVCSGSEANELALRLARAYTDNHDVVVVDGAYHGNTTSLISLSPYKHNGPGGAGTPPFVQVSAIPDVYRGEHSNAENAGKQYAKDVARCVDAMKELGRAPAAFFCESVPSCAGQVVFPPGYLHEAYGIVRDAGGICVADEVQVGFGRVGSRFWGFELQDVVPDIVTMGKPMGNGHPVAAVVTTTEIAQAFDNGMEYFNTFGGNPVSCAVGLSVLDVIHDEHLQDNALKVGGDLFAALTDLQERHELVGDVRGVGLFLGVELVLDRVTKAPATQITKDVAEELKNRNILASTDGPFENVLKIKPPLCFTNTNAETYASALDETLTMFARRPH